MPRLVVKNKNTQEEQIYNLPQDLITVGRSNACDIEIADKAVSRKHFEIVNEGGDYFLIDLKSGNGTSLNGKKIRPIEKHLLRPSDLVGVEQYEIAFTLLEDVLSKPIEEDTDTDIIEVKMIKKVLQALGKDSAPSLEVLNGVAEGKKIYFTEDLQEVDIGRDPNSVLCIDETVISRHHARLVRKWGGIVLLDFESRNGCYVNNEKVTEKQLRDGDKVLLGTVKLIYRNPQDINIEAIGQEISRKKKEAALREAEMMEIARKRNEEEQKAFEEKAKEMSEPEPAAESFQSEPLPAENPPPEENTDPVEPSPSLPEQSVNNPSMAAVAEGLSSTEKILIGVGGVVLLLALVAIISLLMN